MNKRELVEKIIIEQFEHVRPFNPEDRIIEPYKDGTFGISNLAYALYSTGHSLRGMSYNKFGLIYEDGQTIFSIGHFRKEHDTEDSNGYLIITAPRGQGVVEKLSEFVKHINMSKIPCEGVYARFLTLEQYVELINLGALPAKENPWHPECPEEDETYCNSVLTLVDLIEVKNGEIEKIKLVPGESKNARRKLRDSYNRFTNFLARNNYSFNLRLYRQEDRDAALELLKVHFQMLENRGKRIGSTFEDHINSLDELIVTNPEVMAFIGELNGQPISLMVTESLSSKQAGIYTGFTLRDPAHIASEHLSDMNNEGFTAICIYTYIQLFKELIKRGKSELKLGGSETPDLNIFKRQLGAKIETSYWVFFPNHNP